MTGPLQEQQWSEELKEKTQQLTDRLEKRSRELDGQLQRTDERTKEMLRVTNRRISEFFHEKMELTLAQLRLEEYERLLHWQRRCEDVRTVNLSELAAKLIQQVLGKEGAPHD